MISKDLFEKYYMDLVIAVDGLDVLLDVVGAIEYFGGRHFVVVTDCPALEIADDEYEIFEIIKTESGAETIISVENEDQYNELIQIWEDKISEVKQPYSDD
jgi:ABC-type uncharacterized transport system ATPase subunit